MSWTNAFVSITGSFTKLFFGGSAFGFLTFFLSPPVFSLPSSFPSATTTRGLLSKTFSFSAFFVDFLSSCFGLSTTKCFLFASSMEADTDFRLWSSHPFCFNASLHVFAQSESTRNQHSFAAFFVVLLILVLSLLPLEVVSAVEVSRTPVFFLSIPLQNLSLKRAKNRSARSQFALIFLLHSSTRIFNPSSPKSISPSFATNASIRIEQRALAVILPLALVLLLSSFTVDTTPLSRYPASLAHFTNICAVYSSFVSTANINGSNRNVSVFFFSVDDKLSLTFVIKAFSSTASCETNTHSPPFRFAFTSSSVRSANTDTRPEHELVVHTFSHPFATLTNSRIRSSTRPALLLSSSFSSSSSSSSSKSLFLIVIVVVVFPSISSVRFFLRSNPPPPPPPNAATTRRFCPSSSSSSSSSIFSSRNVVPPFSSSSNKYYKVVLM